jgi:hypothetical protein
MHGAVPPEAGRGGNPAGQHGRERRLVHLDQQRRSREPATEVGDVLAERGGECLGQLVRAPWSASTRSPRGFSTVAASVHGPATWTLSGP